MITGSREHINPIDRTLTTMNSNKTKILIVDDNPINLGLAVHILGEAGFDTVIADRGIEAIETAKYCSPNLILMDLKMPGLSGIEICSILKNHKLTKSIPIIVLTAWDDEDNKSDAFAAGAVDFATKPFHSMELLGKIDLHLKMNSIQLQLQQKELELQTTKTNLDAANREIERLSNLIETIRVEKSLC
jgi:DNA-binding response OmpR family regulator